MKDLNDKDIKQELSNLYQRLSNCSECKMLDNGNEHYWWFQWAKAIIKIVEVYDMPNLLYKLAKDIESDPVCSSAKYIKYEDQ